MSFSGCRLTPDGNDEKEATDAHEHGLCGYAPVALDAPEDGDSDDVGDAGDDVELGGDDGAVGDDAVLAEADELVGGGVAVGEKEVADEVHPGLAELAAVAEELPVGLDADGEVRLAGRQRLGPLLLEEEPGGAEEDPEAGGDADDDDGRVGVVGGGGIGVQAKGGADGDDEHDGVADAHGGEGDVAELVALQHLAVDILVLADVAAHKRLSGLSGGGGVAG